MADIGAWIDAHRQEIARWPLVVSPPPGCMVTGCLRTAHTHGICKPHYFRARRAWLAGSKQAER